MASNMASRRFKKANRRKAVVAERRKAEASDATLPAVIRRAVAGPILHCRMHDTLFETGMGTLIVVRGAPGETVLCTFLLDAYCLGIKDIIIRAATMAKVEIFLEGLEIEAPLKPVAPAYARKLVRDLAAWAQSIGFQPHRDFTVAERILGDVDVASCGETFTFGRDGKPFYVAGPDEPPALVHQRMQRLSERVGSGGFDYMLPVDDEDLVSEMAGQLVDAQPSLAQDPAPRSE
jgi:hypothetical protein